MAYHATADVKAMFPAMTFSATSNVTSTKIEEIISITESTVNSMLTAFYVVPITGTEALKIIKDICIKLSASEVVEILRKTGIPNGNADENNRATSWKAEAYGKLKGIQKYVVEGPVEGAISLIDAVSKGYMSSAGAGNPNIVPRIKKDTVQW